MPTIIGTQGDDMLAGTAGDDIIAAGWGDDEVNAGDGNDTIVDLEGSSVLRGGAGDDFIRLSGELNGSTIYQDIVRTKLIEAGDGADIVLVERTELQNLSIDLGAGADLLTFSIGTFGLNAEVATGTGADRIVLDHAFGEALRSHDYDPIVITDFTAGAGGDVLDIGSALERLLPAYGSSTDNPFASGHLILVQDGADLIIRVDVDGAAGAGNGGPYDRDLFRLENVSAADLTVHNFAGYDPAGGALAHSIVNGTSGSEWLKADTGGSDVNGLGGNDRLTGGAGDDQLDGGIGNDIVDGAYGNDIVRGGDGDDVLIDPSGSDSFEGGAGNDTIDIRRHLGDDILDVVAINAGDGDDFVRFEGADDVLLTVDLGAGNDRYEKVMGGLLTLGSGQDRVVFGNESTLSSIGNSQPLVITDFTAGNNGDILEIDRLSNEGWDFTTNPFATGHLRLVQDGDDTLVIADYDGSGPQTYDTVVARLQGVEASSLTAFNFNGYAPGGSASAFTVGAGTSGNDHLYGSNGADIINGGDGDDIIEDRKSGSDTLIGGAGDDQIIVRRYDAYIPGPKVVTINAGVGSDTVELGLSFGQVTADLGADDDRLIIHGVNGAPTSVMLGSGSDVIELSIESVSNGFWDLTIQDFQTGSGGDRLDWASYAEHRAFDGDPDFNPFYDGSAKLVQVGSDVQLQIEFGNISGEQSTLFVTVMTFKNVNAADFTAFNLGYEPFLATATGTAGDDNMAGGSGIDVIYGHGGNDQIGGADGDDNIWGGEGLDNLTGGLGNDLLRGENGDDTLSGGGGADNLDGGNGIDIVDGGDGNDRIFDWRGVDQIIGGAGNDFIKVAITHDSQAPVLGSLNAGDGNDIVELSNSYIRPGYSIDLGAGDDLIKLNNVTSPVTLGAGRDTIQWSASFNINGVLVVNDFQTGDAGDVFDLDTFVEGPLGYLAIEGMDLFEAGYLQLKQVGTEVRLLIYKDGYTAQTAARFLNTDISQFTSANFGGLGDPQADPSRAIILTSNYTLPAGAVRYYDNHTPLGDLFHHLGYSPAYKLENGVTLTNHGTVTYVVDRAFGNPTGVYGGFSPGATFVNAVDGSLFVRDEWVDLAGGTITGGDTYGVVSTVFQNQGLLDVSAASGTVYGVYGDAAFTNSGTVNVTSPYEAYGVYSYNAAAFSNSGEITVHGGEFAVGVYWGDITSSGFNNAGTITVTTDPASEYGSIGVYLGGRTGIEYHHYNSGFITADIAIFADAWIRTGAGAYEIVDYLHNSGVINGAVMLAAGNDVVINIGTMLGRTQLEDGNDLYDGVNGYHSGSVEGGLGNDTLNGGVSDESFYGDEGNDALNGGGGDDLLEGGAGDDAITGGSGFDTASYWEAVAGVTVSLAIAGAQNTIGAGMDTLSGIEDLLGSAFADRLTGNDSGNFLVGYDGDDRLDGNAGADVLDGGDGDDYLFGRTGSDTLIGGAGYDRLYGGTGNDIYYVDDVDDYAYELVGEGQDEVIASLDHQLRVEVENLTLVGSALIGKGNAGDNDISGNDAGNRLYGYAGNDSLNGSGGDDYLFGDMGNDTLMGGGGYDRMYGGTGNDTYIVGDATDYAYESAAEGTDRVVASINHTLRANVEELELAGSADLRGWGNASANLLIGNIGNNLLYGRDGNDRLEGNSGNDILYGENGDDGLLGGVGQDRFYGGAGADDFIFDDGDFAGMTSSTAERIHDFAQGLDQIDLGAVDANSALAGDQAFAFIGTGAFTGVAGQLRYQQISGNTYVQGDTDGDGDADFWIRLDGLHSLQASDFVI